METIASCLFCLMQFSLITSIRITEIYNKSFKNVNKRKKINKELINIFLTVKNNHLYSLKKVIICGHI